MKRALGNRLVWIEDVEALNRAGICHLADGTDAEEALCGKEFGDVKMIVRGTPPRHMQCQDCLREREYFGA